MFKIPSLESREVFQKRISNRSSSFVADLIVLEDQLFERIHRRYKLKGIKLLPKQSWSLQIFDFISSLQIRRVFVSQKRVKLLPWMMRAFSSLHAFNFASRFKLRFTLFASLRAYKFYNNLTLICRYELF